MNMDMQMRIGRNLRTLRKGKRWNQRETAKKIPIGQSLYADYEQGVKMADFFTLNTLSQLYNLPIHTLMDCDIQSAMSDYFLHMEYTQDDTRLLTIYKKLSPPSKQRLLAKAKALVKEESEKRREAFRLL